MAPTPEVTPHRAHWYLSREGFELVPGASRLYRLTDPDREGQRRTRQAVSDLRACGFAVHADFILDPQAASALGSPERSALQQRRRAAAASARSPQRTSSIRTAAVTPARPSDAAPAAVPSTGTGRGRSA